MGKNHIPNNYFPLGLKNNKVLPFDYRVEYLKGDGTAYINTLEKFNNETDEVEITIRAAGLNTQTIFGGRVSATSKFCIMGLGSTGYYDIYCSDGSAYADYRATAAAPGAKCILKMSKYGRYIYNAATLQNLNANTTVGVNFVMNDYAYLFYGSGSPWATNKFTGEIYGLVWKRMGIVIHEYIPVVKDGVGYMFDRATGRLVGNTNTTGAFLFPERMEYEPEPENKPYDAEVEWLKSDGNQYIDTGLLADSTLGYEIFAALTSTWNIGIGAMGLNGGNTNYRHYIRRSGTSNVGIGMKTTDAYSTHQYVSDDCMHHFVVDWTSNTSLVDATYKSNLGSFNNFSTGVTFHLFAVKQDSDIRKGIFKMGRCTFYRNGVMVADYHPVRVGKVGCMYEAVTGTLVYNQGTGEFIVGNDLSDKEYDAEVEYIQQTTNQYIDTGVRVTKGVRAEIKIGTDLSIGSAATLVGGARVNNTTNAFVSLLFANGYTDYPHHFRFDYGTGSSTQVQQLTPVDQTQKEFTIRMYGSDTGKRGTCNTEVIKSSLTTEVDNNFSFLLLAFNNNGTATTQNPGNYPTKLYYCKIWENDILRRDFIPVRRNGRGLLYDRVTKTLYGSPNGGFFTYGADRKIQEREAYDARVEYVETTSSTYQTIDTLLNADSTLGVEIGQMAFANFQEGVLYRGGSSSYIRHHLSNGVTAGKWGYYAGPGTVGYGEVTAANSQFHCAVYDPVGKIGRVDSTTTEIEDTSVWDTGLTYYLFDRHDSNGTNTRFAGRIYYARFFRNGQLVADMVPVRKNGKGYLYDQVRGILFGGVGTLSYGDDLYEYVTDGLIGWYDAIDNTGLGFHSEDTLFWKNKANETHTWTRYRIQNVMWKGGEMTLASESSNATILPGAFTEPWDNGEISSLEFAGMFNGTTNTSNTNQECQLFYDGCASGTAPMNTTKITFVNQVGGEYADCIYVTDYFGRRKIPFSFSNYLGKPFQLSCTTSVAADRLAVASLNGTDVTTEWGANAAFGNGVGVAVINGRNQSSNRGLDGAIYGMRFYDRYLTPSERAKNLKTDIARYGVF